MDIDIYATVAKQLRIKRLQAGLTIEGLAETAGISTGFLAYVETNKKKPSLATITKLTAALDISACELFEEHTIRNITDEKQKVLNKLLKLLQNQNPEGTEIILATVAALAKELLTKQIRRR